MPHIRKSLDFKVQFGSDLNEIDADTFVSSIMGISAAIHEINKEIQPDKKINIRIKSLPPGSFIVHLSIFQGYIDSLMQCVSDNHIPTVAQVIAIFAGILTIKKHLKGEKPKEVKEDTDVVNIENNEGSNIIIDKRTYNIYQHNPNIDSALTKTFDIIAKDEYVSDLNILDDNDHNMFSVGMADFESMALPYDIPSDEKHVRIEEAKLIIFKVVFQENFKWEFYHNGNRISAKLKDPSFYSVIDRGESFSKGDILHVELQTNQVFDKSVNTYVNKSYQINKVLKHIPRAKQENLWLK